MQTQVNYQATSDASDGFAQAHDQTTILIISDIGEHDHCRANNHQTGIPKLEDQTVGQGVADIIHNEADKQHLEMIQVNRKIQSFHIEEGDAKRDKASRKGLSTARPHQKSSDNKGDCPTEALKAL